MLTRLPACIGKHYRPVAELGAGVSATVYRCETKDGHHVAVKKFTPVHKEGTYRKRMAAEVLHLASSASPHVVKLIDWDTDADRCPSVVMELADGCVADLTAFGAVGLPLAAWIVYQAASGLRSSSTIHRDLKPENLLLHNGPGNDPAFHIGETDGARVVVADWGLCRPDGAAALTRTVEVMGTPLYMSPEQCRSTHYTDKRTDLYALGVIFWELALGTVPFQARDPHEMLRMQCDDTPDWPQGQPPGVMRILTRSLVKDPQQRYASFTELQEDLIPLFTMRRDWTYPFDGPPDARITTRLSVPESI